MGELEIEKKDNDFNEIKIEKGEKVMTEYLKEKVSKVKEQMESEIFKHFAIYGDEGSGKMSFV